MRPLLILAVASTLTACATQNTNPPAAPAPTAKAETKAPQCWSGDAGKFINAGEKAVIAGVNVECKLTSDGKAAQWMGNKH